MATEEVVSVAAPVAAPEVPSAAAPALDAALLARIRKQIEYYFGDANFKRDKFLREKANEDADGG